jgi:hypothetical protein
MDNEVDEETIPHNAENIFLKVDTQGFEMEVLRGAKNLLEKGKIKIIFIELCTIEKYKGQAKYDEIFNYLHTFGFVLYDIHTSYWEDNGQLSEFDAVFIHKQFLVKF